VPRRILLPTGPQGVTQEASRWVATLASRFDAEVGLLRIEQRKSGFWQINSSLPAVVEDAGASRADAATALADLRRGGIDAYEIDHPGGADCDALGELCESGAFDLVVMSVGAAGEGESRGRLLAAVRRQTSAPVLSVRTVRAPALFAPGHFERLPENNIDGLGLPA